MAWEDNFNKLIESSLKVDDSKTLKFVLEEHKTKGTMNINIREFKETETYSGATKNGLMIKVESLEQINDYQKQFNDFFESIKEMI